MCEDIKGSYSRRSRKIVEDRKHRRDEGRGDEKDSPSDVVCPDMPSSMVHLPSTRDQTRPPHQHVHASPPSLIQLSSAQAVFLRCASACRHPRVPSPPPNPSILSHNHPFFAAILSSSSSSCLTRLTRPRPWRCARARLAQRASLHCKYIPICFLMVQREKP